MKDKITKGQAPKETAYKDKSKPLNASLKLLFTGMGIILFWRGIWNFADDYLFIDYPIFSNIVSVLAGATIIIWMKAKDM